MRDEAIAPTSGSGAAGPEAMSGVPATPPGPADRSGHPAAGSAASVPAPAPAPAPAAVAAAVAAEAIPSAAAADRPVPANPARDKRTCLVVDDSRVVRKVARRLLEHQGFVVTEAEDGRVALDACRRAMPECILLDWNMPVMNGIEFLKALRREFGDGEPTVVFCTTENDISFIEQAITHGAQEFIMKPFDEDILVGKFAQVGLL